MLVSERVGQVFVEDAAGHRERLEFTEHGSGEAWVVLLPAPLLSRRSLEPLARHLAAGGLHVVTLDPLGQGRSDRPADPLAYSVAAAARHVVSLLDHLGAGQAVVGGTSLGSAVALTVAAEAPERVRGLVLDAPLLDNGFAAALVTLGPLMLTARHAPLPLTLLRLVTRPVPRGPLPHWLGVALDGADQRPRALAAMLHGVLATGLAPDPGRRRRVTAPTLVVAHPGDPWHRTSDARLLGEELPHATVTTAGRRVPRRGGTDPAAMEVLDFCRRSWKVSRRRRRAGA
ncbi:alpha/beta fold hydrolase [Nocardioides perillae]|uniref:Pimeloyl-ACP methyl ester carboxylesterase n=1 Tax=Nocardioides perillae TaxID=1119534 RepID=A0A7Y9RVC8_9ACTN|nr:alpha/beta hydrolase [Nocardioides perillae]NYG55548.1 pimeloyl-ACP methyl ester carboxylesterase [Nocardioides perillae]